MTELNIKLGRFTLKTLLGKGGFGEVYKAYDPKLDRDVALKVLHQGLMADLSFINKARKEASLVQQIQHPNVVKIFELGEADGRAYIEMEFIDGRPLSEFIKSGRRFNIGQIVSFVEQISSALDATHAKNIVHRDVKPANILIDKSGLVHLVDFGLAHAAKSSLGSSSTSAGIGTAMYMSPEQAMGRTGDKTTDIYSLGIVTFELLTGQLPFEADNLPGYIAAHLNQKPPDPKKINSAVTIPMRDVIYKVLSKSPAGRYKSAGDFAHALKLASEKPEARRNIAGGCVVTVLATVLFLILVIAGMVFGPFSEQAQQIVDGVIPSNLFATDIPNYMPTRTPMATETQAPPAPTEIVVPTFTQQSVLPDNLPTITAPAPVLPTATNVPLPQPTNTPLVISPGGELPNLLGTSVRLETLNGQNTGITVQIVDGAGNPVSGHWLKASTQKQDLAGNWVVDEDKKAGYTDDIGQIFFDLAPGNYIVATDLRGYNWGNASGIQGQANIPVEAGKNTRLTITLGRLAVGFLRGDGSVITGQYVAIFQQKIDLAGNWVADNQVYNGYTDNSGVLSVDLAPGYYIVASDLRGYNWGDASDRMGKASIAIQPGQENRLVVHIGQLQIGLKDFNGNPVKGQWVGIYKQKQDISGKPIQGDRVEDGYTDNTGIFIADLTPGEYAVNVRDVYLYSIQVVSGKITFTDGAQWQVK